MTPAIDHAKPDTIGGNGQAAGARPRETDPEALPAVDRIRSEPFQLGISLAFPMGIADIGALIIFYPEGKTFIGVRVRLPDRPGGHFDVLIHTTEKKSRK